MAVIKRYGWKRGLPEPKPFKFFPQRGFLATPPSVDLQSECPAVYDQGNLGSCTANAGSALAEFVMKKLGLGDFIPSRLAIYYWERVLEGTPNEDSGASLSDCVKVLASKGAPHESMWWYDVNKFKVAPPKTVVADGWRHRANPGLSIAQDLDHMKACLVEGFPFIFGFTVYESFEAGNWDSTGAVMPMPKANEQVLGGHAVMAVGYDDAKGCIKVRNSWGASWGQQGYFWMPYKFICDTNYADDFWTIHSFKTFKLDHEKCEPDCPCDCHKGVKKACKCK